MDEVLQREQKTVQEEDAGLHALYSVLSLQNQMQQENGNELGEQNDITDDLAYLARSTDNALCTETRHANMVDRKSDLVGGQWQFYCCSWLLCLFQSAPPGSATKGLPAVTPTSDGEKLSVLFRHKSCSQ